MNALDFLVEREELGWYFAGVGPTLGLHAAGLEAGGGRIYDELASHTAHMARRKHEHRSMVTRLDRVQRSLVRCGPHCTRTVRLAFTSFGAGRASYRLLNTIAAAGLALVGLALDTVALQRLWRVKAKLPPLRLQDETMPELGYWAPDSEEVPTQTQLLALLEDEVCGLRRGNRIPPGHRLQHVLDEALSRCWGSLESYSSARQVVMQDRRTARAADNDALIAAERRQMGGGH